MSTTPTVLPRRSFCDIAIDILRATHDGDDLDPTDLKLVETMVNARHVSEQAEAAFDDLAARVAAGYVKPWLHGIEHLTIDHAGYVYWKGREVEHFTLGWHRSAEAATQAAEIARRCRIVEARGGEVTSSSVVWRWQE